MYIWDTVHLGVVDDRVALGLGLLLSVLIALLVYQGSVRSVTIADDGSSFTLEDILRSLNDLFLKIYQHSPVPYVTLDRRGVIVSANMSAARLFGVADTALVGVDLFEELKGSDEHKASLLPGKFERGVFINDEEASLTNADGAMRWVLFSVFPFRDAAGHKRGLATLVDITKQKEIDRAKTEFVSLASHQLRTPLAAIKWNTELLQMKYGAVLVEEARAYTESIAHNAARMETLIGDFLAASRFELGALTADKQPISVPAFLDGIVQDVEAAAAQKGIQLERVYDPALESCQSDSHLLGMAIGNLLSNAIKYTREGGQVRVATELAGNECVITVADTGMGIPAQEQDKIFTKIFRASNAQAHVPDGTGLGLYIAREAMRVLGGDITFSSQEGKGTTFLARFPR